MPIFLPARSELLRRAWGSVGWGNLSWRECFNRFSLWQDKIRAGSQIHFLYPGIFSHHVFAHRAGGTSPKILTIRKSMAAALFVSAPLRWFYAIFKPAIRFLNAASNWVPASRDSCGTHRRRRMAHSEEELRFIVRESEKSAEVTPLGRELVFNVLDLRDRVVRDIMTPRGEIVYLNLEDGFEANVKKAIESRHTRFPLCRENLDNTVGLIHIKELLTIIRAEHPDLLKIKRDIIPIPEMMPLEKLLKLFLSKPRIWPWWWMNLAERSAW